MLQVWLLGQFEMKLDGRRVVLSARAAQSLLAYLMLSAGTPHRREKLAGLLWSDLPDENARRNLRTEIWRIRKALVSPAAPNADYILADELTLAFNPNSEYWLDAAQLQTPASDIESLVSSLSLYRGELLPGFYDDWISLERERLQTVFENKMQTLLETLIAAQRWNAVVEWGERWIVQGQTPEPAYRALMLAHVAMGNRAHVAATMERCKMDLQRELAVEPSPETNKLYQDIMVGQPVGPVDLTPIYHVRVQLPVLDEPPAPGEPPFKGLEFFDEQDANLFFGREQLTEKLAQQIRANQFLAVVVGASGSGKSSVVRAGLIPAIRRDVPAERLYEWRVFVMTPTEHPLEELATVLARDESLTATAALADDLAREPRSLYFWLRRQTADTITQSSVLSPRYLLIIDQFEELFTLCRDELEREQFIDNLVTALGQGRGVTLWSPDTGQAQGTAPTISPVHPFTPSPLHSFTLVLTIRADFYAHLAQYPELRDAVAKHQEFIGPMNADELRRAIEEPAKKSGWEFEPGLVDLILRDVGDEPGALPLLSHALLETWRRRSGHTLTHKGYHDAGGVHGAIAQTAESVYQQLTPDEQMIARDIFLRLTELGDGTEDTRRCASFDELVPQNENAATVRAILTRLADARLLTLHQDRAEVAHEALIREWHRLREWLNQDREGLRLHRQITQAANEWEVLERDAGALYRGARLIQARDFVAQNPDALNAHERAFVEASQENEERESREREAQQQRELLATQELVESSKRLAETEMRANKQLRRRAIFLASAFVIAALLAAVALFLNDQSQQHAAAAQNNAQEAETQRANAEKASRIATARELAANTIGNLSVDPERSALLAMQAIQTTAQDNLVLPEAQDALHRAVADLRVARVFPIANGAYSAAFTPDGKQVVVMGIGAIKRYDVATGQMLAEYPTHSDVPDILTLSADGTKLATLDHEPPDWNQKAELKIFDIQSGALVQNTELPVTWNETWLECLDAEWKRYANPDHRENALQIVDFASNKILHTLKGHADAVSSCAFSPDGKKILTTSNDRTAKVWDAETGKELYTISNGTAGVTRMKFSPDSKKIAGGDYEGLAHIWDAETGKELLTLEGFGGTVFRAVYSPDDKTIATTDCDAKAKLWDAETAQQLQTMYADKCLYWVAFSPDGKRLITSSDDGGLREYLLDVNDLVALAQKRLTRTWTPEECEQFLHVEKCPQ